MRLLYIQHLLFEALNVVHEIFLGLLTGGITAIEVGASVTSTRELIKSRFTTPIALAVLSPFLLFSLVFTTKRKAPLGALSLRCIG
ncbi:Uncharacterized protein TCM_039506 [Theobroma cacao]|uniref:Uncharacterized protein n=1 Tax=Theobroma cacao TaxID=3641 RepID=A0A061GRM9_THECC|nr:Uncharacterized protein TCM_039506 [Theobroma cacao]